MELSKSNKCQNCCSEHIEKTKLFRTFGKTKCFQLHSNRKAQGMPLNIVIIAAICLIVLVILVMIFTGRIGIFAGESANCLNNGGTCVAITDGCGSLGGLAKESTAYKCLYTASNVIQGKKAGDTNPSQTCCIKVG